MQREWEEEGKKSVGSQTVNIELKPWNQKHTQQVSTIKEKKFTLALN